MGDGPGHSHHLERPRQTVRAGWSVAAQLTPINTPPPPPPQTAAVRKPRNRCTKALIEPRVLHRRNGSAWNGRSRRAGRPGRRGSSYQPRHGMIGPPATPSGAERAMRPRLPGSVPRPAWQSNAALRFGRAVVDPLGHGSSGSGRPAANHPDGHRDEQHRHRKQPATLDPLEWPEPTTPANAHSAVKVTSLPAVGMLWR